MAQDMKRRHSIYRKTEKPGKRVSQRFPGDGVAEQAGGQSSDSRSRNARRKFRPAACWKRMCALESPCRNARAEDARDGSRIATASQKPGFRIGEIAR